jgi:seryl-tRNA synthetase
MGIFKPKKKTLEIIFVEENVIMVGKDKYHHHDSEIQEIKKQLFLINKTLKTMAKTQSETAAELRAIKDQNEKARVEILAKIKALEDALATAGNTSDEVDAAVQDLKASVQTDDDMNPDAPNP